MTLGSTTEPFRLAPMHFVSLALLLQYQTIRVLLHTHTHPPDFIHKTYALLQAILQTASELLFGPHAPPDSIADFHGLLRASLAEFDQAAVHQLISSIDQILVFAFKGTLDGFYLFTARICSLVAVQSVDDRARHFFFNLESPFGIFIRRCKLSICNLEFDQAVKISGQLQSFCSFHHDSFQIKPHHQHLFKNVGNTPSSASFDLDSGGVEKKKSVGVGGSVDPITTAYLEFTDIYAPDFNRNSNALRRFYDTRANPSLLATHMTSSIHSKALLSLSYFHYFNDAFPAAYDALEESTRLARMTSDRKILDKSTCLRRRLDHKTKSTTIKHNNNHMNITGPIQSQIQLESQRNIAHSILSHERLFWDANEELFSVSVALDSVEPLNKVYGRLFRAKRMTLNVIATHFPSEEPRDLDKVTWFGLQAKLWYLKGQPGLSKVYEELGLKEEETNENNNKKFLEEEQERPGLMDKTLIICDKAIRIANRGEFVKALIVLMEEALLDKTNNIKSFEKLHYTVFKVLKLKASHEGDGEALLKIDGYFNRLVLNEDEDDGMICVRKQIEDLYSQSQTLIQAGHASLSLTKILRGITLSNKMSLLTLESVGVTRWAEAMLWCQPDESGIERVMERLERMFDCPGLRDRVKDCADALLVRARWGMCLIGKTESCTDIGGLDRVVWVLDLLRLAEIGYKKTEDLKKCQVCIAYRKIIINEALHLGYIKTIKELNDERFNPIEEKQDSKEEEEEVVVRKKKKEGKDDDFLDKIINGLNCLSAQRFATGGVLSS